MQGALQINDVCTTEVMTKFDKVDLLSLEDVIDEDLLKSINEIGYSRIPICQKKDEREIIAVFLTKSLVGYNPKNQTIAEAF